LPRTRTTKKLAQRIDLDYFKRPSPLRRWRFLLSVAAPVLAVACIAWFAIRSDRRVYSAGNLSFAHAVLTKQCSACHLSTMGFYSAKAIDQKCVVCHDGPVHHATQAFTPTCASCHADHRGAIRLAATSDANCTQCHANLETRGSSEGFAKNISRFESSHPEFAALRPGRHDPGTIQLNHYVTCNRICWDRMAAACKWFARIAIARLPMVAARGPMEIRRARRALRKFFPPVVR
jgi:hypothetical protein